MPQWAGGYVNGIITFGVVLIIAMLAIITVGGSEVFGNKSCGTLLGLVFLEILGIGAGIALLPLLLPLILGAGSVLLLSSSLSGYSKRSSPGRATFSTGAVIELHAWEAC